MRVAGIDPGTINTGVAIVDGGEKKPALIFSGTIRAGQTKPIAERLQIIYTELQEAFQEWKPDLVALEDVFFQKDFKAAVRVGEARAVAMLAASMNQIPVVEYPPARVKQSVCGNGRAAKNQVQYMVRHLLGIKGGLSPDSADAIAVALCHFHSEKWGRSRKELSRV